VARRLRQARLRGIILETGRKPRGAEVSAGHARWHFSKSGQKATDVAGAVRCHGLPTPRKMPCAETVYCFLFGGLLVLLPPWLASGGRSGPALKVIFGLYYGYVSMTTKVV